MDPKEFLINFKIKFDLVLSEYLHKKKTEYNKISPEFAVFFEKLEDFSMRGGKRHRSALVFHTAKLFNPELDDEDLLYGALLMEMAQAFLLIHDDVVDKDDLRRGGLTTHRMFELEAEEKKWTKKEEYGQAMAIYNGDTAFALIFQIIAESNFSDRIKVKLTNLLSEQLIDTLIGQFHDVQIERIKKYSEKDIEFIQTYKTAKYSFGTPSLVGAMLGGAEKKELKLVDSYAIPAGIAFQVRDDILGIFGEEDKTGKSAYSDIKQGKKTLLILKTLENGSSDQKNIIEKYLGKADLTENEAELVRKAIRDSGSLEYSIQLSQEYVKQAKEKLSLMPNRDSESFAFINGLIEYIAVRDV